jgi:hypothetical protein
VAVDVLAVFGLAVDIIMRVVSDFEYAKVTAQKSTTFNAKLGHTCLKLLDHGC